MKKKYGKCERLSALNSVKYKKTFYFCAHKHKEFKQKTKYAKLTSNISSNLSALLIQRF
jgi:hypothetical protein